MADGDNQHLHTASATAGADGVRTDDGVTTTRLAVATDAEDRDGATTPEHLMAAALAGCLHQALGVAASTRGGDAASARVTATVTLESADEGGYSAAFELVVSGLDGNSGEQVLQQAQVLCPFTKALDGPGLTVRLG